MRPAWDSANPYNRQFADALQAHGFSVEEWPYGVGRVITRGLRSGTKLAALVIHWPDEWFAPTLSLKGAKALLKLAVLRRLPAFRRMKIVWVVHNLSPHESDRSPASPLRSFFAALDGLIFLSSHSREMALQRYGELERIPFAIIPHGHYRDVATAEVRSPQPLGERPVVLGLIGQIRRYKGAEHLARLVAGYPQEALRLMISGACPEASLQAELAAIAAAAPQITLECGWLTDQEVEQRIDASDAVVLPYRAILNSGSALLALSRNRPVLAPRLGALEELASEVGEGWLHLYDGALTREVLDDFLTWLHHRGRRPEPNLSGRDWRDVGRQAAALFGENE